MCGINGIIHHNTSLGKISSALQTMNRCIVHRGPDDDGFFIDDNDRHKIGLAMRRLAIIDLDSGKQPIQSEDGNTVIVFNGEIYNYQVLRQELTGLGVHFRTQSDTEVILQLYLKYGAAAFGKLDGMYAIAIYDKKENKLLLARDFFGEKPLYYYTGTEQFIWASELKSIMAVMSAKPPICREALNLYFQLTYIPAPYSIYQGIRKLQANHLLTYDLHTDSTIVSEITREKPQFSKSSFEDAKLRTRELITESVTSRSIADVPLGAFLSGGVDSSIISLLLAQHSTERINTFSIGFSKKSFDETDKSRVVAKMINSNHHEYILGENDMKDRIDEILLNFDEPFADSSSIPTFLVAHKTASSVKVALTGDGGDEVFGGYNKYYMGKINQYYTGIVPEKLHRLGAAFADKLLSTRDDHRGKRFKVRRLVHAVDYGGDFYYNIISLAFQKAELTRLFNQPWQAPGVLNYYRDRQPGPLESIHDFREADRHLSLEGDMLVKVDRTSMLASLECRAPFLNKKLWDFTNSLPDSYLINGWSKKHLLKKAFERDFPERFLEKSKQGFGVPVGDWLRGHLRKEVERYSEREYLVQQDIFEPTHIRKLVQEHLSGTADNTFRVWTFYCFQKWYAQRGYA